MPQIDIGIITIREDEFAAVLKVFPDEVGEGFHKGKFREYALRSASAGRAGRYTLAILRLPEQGNGEAQDGARDLLEDLNPSLLLVVGIAGGLPSDDLTLGDVVLSMRINDYCVAAQKEGEAPQYAISGGPIPRTIQAGISNLSARQRDLGDWTASLPPKPTVNWTAEGQLYGPADWQQRLRATLEKHYESATSRPPIFMSGPIAASDRLVKDPEVLFPWIETARNLLAVEMESGGVFRAARDRCPMLAIRGLSDIVGLKRADAWTKYAAESAAYFTRAYLQTRPILPNSVPPPPSSQPPKSSEGSAPVTQNQMNVSGGHVEASNIVVGVQHVYGGRTATQALDAVEPLVGNGLLDAATEQLDGLERTAWGSMSPVEKFRHRKLQGRVLARREQPLAAASRFEEAADFVPDDEQAQVLKVNALMLRDDLQAAHALARKMLDRYPSLVSAKAAWITSAPDGTRAENLLTKPWEDLEQSIARALADRLIAESRMNEAVDVLRHSQTIGRDLAYWSAYSVALLKYQEQLGGISGPLEPLAEALVALEKALSLCGVDGLKAQKLEILLNIGRVHRLRKELDEEWRVLRSALELDPALLNGRVRMAKVLLDLNRHEDGILMLEGLLKDGPDYVRCLLADALATRKGKGDLERSAELFEQAATIAAPSEAMLHLDGAEGLVRVCCTMKEWDRALAACGRFAEIFGPFRANELAARIYLEQDDSASARRVLIDALELKLTAEQQRTLGVLFMHAGDNDRAVEQLELVAPRDQLAESTKVLITAAQATNRNELVIRICRTLRAAGIETAAVIDAEAIALFRRGNIGEAIAVVEPALAAKEDRFLRLRLSMLGVAAGRLDLIERDPSRLPQFGDGDPSLAPIVVGVLRAAGEDDAAIRYAYGAYKANRSASNGWSAIIEAFNPTRGQVNHTQPEVVTVDSAVRIREGETCRWITIEECDPAAAHDELSPDSPIVVAMLGKKVGESFEVPRNFAPPRGYIVDEIQSKYVRAYQRCLEQWEEQFPHVPGPMMFALPENLAEDVEGITKQLQPMLEANTQRVEELERIYQQGPVTLHLLASGLKCSSYVAMIHLMSKPALGINCTRSTHEEIKQVLASLESGKKIIVETSALSTLLLLEETDVILRFAGRLAIARATLDELQAHRQEVEARGAGTLGTLGLREGRLELREIDQERRANYLAQIEDLLAKLAGCEVFHEQNHELITPADWDELVKIGGAGAVESLHRAMNSGEPIWCDDMFWAVVAKQRGVRVAWTQLMCHHLVVRSEIESELGYRISAKLLGAGFAETNTNPGAYLEAARLAVWNPEQWPLPQHLRLFEVADWSDKATLLLAVNTLRDWWRHAPSDATANAVTVAMLDRIALRPTGMDVLLPAIERNLEKVFGIDVIRYEQAREALSAWRKARLFRQGLSREGSIAT